MTITDGLATVQKQVETLSKVVRRLEREQKKMAHDQADIAKLNATFEKLSDGVWAMHSRLGENSDMLRAVLDAVEGGKIAHRELVSRLDALEDRVDRLDHGGSDA